MHDGAKASSVPVRDHSVLARLVMVGTSFQRIGFDKLGAHVLPSEPDGTLLDLARVLEAEELCYLATCNRVETYALLADEAAEDALRLRVARFCAAKGGDPRACPHHLEVLRGEAVIQHLFRVVASLESLAAGECEIAGQVRRAAERPERRGAPGDRLRHLFQRAAKVAKQVRQETEIGKTPVSVASLAARAIRDHIKDRPIERAVLIGVGDMTRKIANVLKGRTDLVIVNRTLERAEELAARVGGVAMSLEAFQQSPPAWIDAIVTATSAPEPVVREAQIAAALAARSARGETRPLLLCDLGVPADIDPALGDLHGVRRLDLAGLQTVARENRARLDRVLHDAETLVDAEAARYATSFALRAEAESSVQALLQSRLAHLCETDQKVLRRFAVRLAGRIVGMAQAG